MPDNIPPSAPTKGLNLFPSMDELIKGLSWIRKAPQDDGILKAIVIRPSVDVRKELQRCRLSPESGAEGEAWSRNCWLRFEDGSPHPDV